MSQISRPLIITSPISGEPVRPLIKEMINGDVKQQIAIYTDPASGMFIRKIVLSEEKLQKPS